MEVNRDSIDKILEKVTQTTKNAIKKSGEAVEMTKLRLAVNSDKTKIKDLKLQVGELVYSAYIGADAGGDTIEDICRQIKETYDEIEEKEKEIAQIRNLKRCPKCGVNNERDASFCKNCAAELDEDDEILKADVVANAEDEEQSEE